MNQRLHVISIRILLFGAFAWTARGSLPYNTALQSYVFEATLLVSNDDLLFPVTNGRSLFEISNGSDYQFEKRPILTFPNGSTLYHTTTILWRRQVLLCPGPLSVCTASPRYYYGLPQPSDLKCISSGSRITPHGFKQYEMAVTNYFITKHSYAHLESCGATNIIVPLLGTSTFTTPTGAVLLQTFEVILYPGHKFDVCNFTHTGEAGSMKHGYVSQDGYRRHTLDFLWKYSRPVDIVVDISCPVWYSYTPESISTASPHMPHHKTEVKQKLVISLVTDPAIIFPDLFQDQVIIPMGTSGASILIVIHTLYKPIDLHVEGKRGRASARLVSLTATSATYSVSWATPHKGRYSVVAKNARGQSATRNVTVTIATAPQVLVDPVEAMVGEGATVSFLCVAISNVPVAINWTRDYLALGHGQETVPVHSQYLAKHQSGLKLTLPAVQLSDSGAYVCTASNTAGTEYRLVRLLVYHQGSPQIDAQYAGPNPVIADTHVEAPLVPIYLHPTTEHSLFLIGGTSLTVFIILLALISLALAKLLSNHWGRGTGKVQARGGEEQQSKMSNAPGNTSSSESSGEE